MKQKLCNFRPFFVIAIMTVIASLFAVFIFNAQVERLLIVTALVIAAIIFVALFVIFRKRIFVFLEALFLFFASPFLGVMIKSHQINENLIYNEKQVLVLGKICDYYRITKGGFLELVLDDVEIKTGDDETKKLGGKVAVYFEPEFIDLSQLNVGRWVFVKTELAFNTIESKDSWELADLAENILAGGFANYYNLQLSSQSGELSDVIKSKIFDVLESSNMESADVSFAMLFGDTNVIDKDVTDIYRDTNISHILAVSGLHVSVIISAICFLLKKLKVPRPWQLALLFVILGFYTYLCNFTISVIRSALMALILNYSFIRGKPYDRLSVLSMLAAVFLLVNPLEIFNLSFVLSFLAVLSIIFMCEPLSRLFQKVFYEKFANMLALLFAVQLGLTTVNIFYFGKFQPLGIIANFVSVPISSFAFVFLILASIVAMIMPFASFLCEIAGGMFKIVTLFSSFVRNLGLLVTLPQFSAFIIPFTFAILFVLSDYCFLKKQNKAVVSLSLAAICAALFFV